VQGAPGRDVTSDEEQAIKSLEVALPDGWWFKELRSQLVGRRPVQHQRFGAVVKGPDRTVVAIALGGVKAAQAGRLGRARASCDVSPVGAATDLAEQP
jgi:hypothetical protein